MFCGGSLVFGRRSCEVGRPPALSPPGVVAEPRFRRVRTSFAWERSSGAVCPRRGCGCGGQSGDCNVDAHRPPGRLQSLCEHLITRGHREPPTTRDRPTARCILTPTSPIPCSWTRAAAAAGFGRYPSLPLGHSTQAKRSPVIEPRMARGHPCLDSLEGKHVTAQLLASHDSPVVIVGNLVEYLVQAL